MFSRFNMYNCGIIAYSSTRPLSWWGKYKPPPLLKQFRFIVKYSPMWNLAFTYFTQNWERKQKIASNCIFQPSRADCWRNVKSSENKINEKRLAPWAWECVLSLGELIVRIHYSNLSSSVPEWAQIELELRAKNARPYKTYGVFLFLLGNSDNTATKSGI